VFTISAAFLFGIALVAMLKYRAVNAGAAVVASLFGFYLASTGVAPAVRHTVAAIATAISRIH